MQYTFIAIAINSGTFSVKIYKKKIVTFLVAVALCGCALPVFSVECFANTVEEKASTDSSGNLFANDPNFSGQSSERGGVKGLYYRVIFAILLVIVMGAVAIYISKKLLPKFANLPGKKIHVTETVHLGPRKTLHLIKIGSQHLLIGSTNESISKLADVTEALTGKSLPTADIEETDAE